MKKTIELFNRWNEKKKEIEFVDKKNYSVRIGDIWWYREGINIGNEISKDGKFMRIGVILENDMGNGLLLIAPMTTKCHVKMKKHYIPMRNYTKYNLKESWIICNQIKLIDKKRLIHLHGSRNNNIKNIVFVLLKKYITILIKKHSKHISEE